MQHFVTFCHVSCIVIDTFSSKTLIIQFFENDLNLSLFLLNFNLKFKYRDMFRI